MELLALHVDTADKRVDLRYFLVASGNYAGNVNENEDGDDEY